MGDRDIVKNEIERVYKRKKNGEEKEVVVPKTASDLQKMQLERLMADPDRPVEIPEQRKKWQPRSAPEFVRHVMGSSAGAGSGEFHVYRGLRRREMNRVDFIEHQAEEEKLDEEYQAKLQQNKEAAESKTAKKRAKRQRKKQKQGLVKKAKAADSSENVVTPHDNAAEEEESGSGSDEEPHFVIGGK